MTPSASIRMLQFYSMPLKGSLMEAMMSDKSQSEEKMKHSASAQPPQQKMLGNPFSGDAYFPTHPSQIQLQN